MSFSSFPQGPLAATWTCKYKPSTGTYKTQTEFKDPSTQEVVWETKPIETLEADINNPEAAVFGANNKEILEHDWNHLWGSLGEQNSEWSEAINSAFQVRARNVLGVNQYDIPQASAVSNSNDKFLNQYRSSIFCWNFMKATDAFTQHVKNLDLPGRKKKVLESIKNETERLKKDQPNSDTFHTVAEDTMTPEQFQKQAAILDDQLTRGQAYWEKSDESSRLEPSVWAVQSYRDLFAAQNPDTHNAYLNVKA